MVTTNFRGFGISTSFPVAMARELSPGPAKFQQPYRILLQLFIVIPAGTIMISIILGLVFSPVILLTWASVRYGERRHSNTAQCADRSTSDGFIGNPDFYGFGIRIGIYLQWLASLLANAFLPKDRRFMAGAYACLTVAFFVAMLVLMFQNNCSYTAEVIVLLNLLWGGSQTVLMPYVDNEFKWKPLRGLQLLIIPLLLPLITVSTWFWVRLAVFGEVDFAPTPRGTSFFLLSHIRSSSILPASQFVAFLCLWMVSTPVLGLIIYSISQIRRLNRLADFLTLLTAQGFITLVCSGLGYVFGIIFFFVGFHIASILGKSRIFNAWSTKPETEETIGQWYVMKEFL